jgi:hypothetical protein
VVGGVGTLIVIVIWAWLFPELRQAEGFETIEAEQNLIR